MGVRVGKMMVAGRIMGVVAKRLKRGTIRNGKREPVGWPATRALGGSRGCTPEDAKSALEFLSVPWDSALPVGAKVHTAPTVASRCLYPAEQLCLFCRELLL